MNSLVVIYIEEKPESYTGPISITIRAKLSERTQAESMAKDIQTLLLEKYS